MAVNGEVQDCIPEGTTYAYVSTNKLKAATEKAGRDFRSDVVTVPTESMMQAIIDASYGDDIYDPAGDASVNALQDKLVEMTGMEAALWVLSGTMGNQICIRTHLTQPPHSVLLDHRAHVHCWESGAMAALSQASVTMVYPKNGRHLTVEDVKANIIADGNVHFPPTRVVSLENTLSGTVLPLKAAKEISEFVRSYHVPLWQQPVAMHLDGARIFDGIAAEGSDLKEYCACFDSISICVAKIGAPMGTIILGSRRFIARAKWFKKMFGGGTRQPGMMAAAASAALDIAIPQISRVHFLTRAAWGEIEKLGYRLALPVESNMIVLDLAASDLPGNVFVKYCSDQGAITFPSGRLVFHHQTSKDGVDRLVSALAQLMKDKRSGTLLEGGDINGGCS